MSFDTKMDILQNMVMRKVGFRELSLNGVHSIISSLASELTSLDYSDTDGIIIL